MLNNFIKMRNPYIRVTYKKHTVLRIQLLHTYIVSLTPQNLPHRTPLPLAYLSNVKITQEYIPTQF